MHTPGPWKLADDSIPFVYSLNSKGYNQFWAGLQSNFDGASANKAELLANANLIAAAPDLLEALERLLRADERPPTEENLSLAVDAMHHAREAIKKAKGIGNVADV